MSKVGLLYTNSDRGGGVENVISRAVAAVETLLLVSGYFVCANRARGTKGGG